MVRIEGTVSDFYGNPIDGADVLIQNDFFEPLYSAKTDLSNHWLEIKIDGIELYGMKAW